MTQSKPLSPAAQAVLDAYLKAPDNRLIVAAALRVAADQVVPEEQPPRGGMRPSGTAQQFQRAATRRKFLAIAAELEGEQ
jgi:hypothetical protein